MLGCTAQPPERNRPLSVLAKSRACRASVVSGVVRGVPAGAVGGVGAYWLLATLAAVSRSKAAAARHVLAAVRIGAVVRPDPGFRRLVEQRIYDRTGLDGGKRRFERRVRRALRFHRDDDLSHVGRQRTRLGGGEQRRRIEHDDAVRIAARQLAAQAGHRIPPKKTPRRGG